MYSWWWVRLSPETCRVKPLRRIKTQLLHLVELISLPWLLLHKSSFIYEQCPWPHILPVRSLRSVICKVPIVILSLHSCCHFYCLQSWLIQVLLLSLALCIQKRVRLSYPKWLLKLYHPCHYLVEYLWFSLPFFKTMLLAMTKILASGQVAASGFKTCSFQAMNSNTRWCYL